MVHTTTPLDHQQSTNPNPIYLLLLFLSFIKMHLPDQIPEISFASAYPSGYPATSTTVIQSANISPPPSRWDIQTNSRMNDQFVVVKSQLLNLLRTGQLANLPMGFPFRCMPTGPTMSRSSYEFVEYIVTVHASRPSRVVFAYTAPGHERKGGQSLPSTNMTWRIKAPSRESSRMDESLTSFVTVAQVEVDPAILETTFAVEFMANPHMLLGLLSASLEQGLHIFMEVAVTGCNVGYPQRSGISYRKGDLVVIVKRNDGQREVVYVYAS